MADPTIIQAGKYQIGRVRFADREDQLGVRTDVNQPWTLLGDNGLIQDLLVEVLGPWVETRRNLIPRPVPVDASDWYLSGGTLALDSVFTRRPGVPTLRRTLTTASSSLIANSAMLAPGLASLTDAIPVTAGETYTVSAYTSASIAGYRSRLRLTWVDSSGAFVANPFGPYATGGVVGGWQRPSFTAVAPVGAAYVAPAVTVSTSSGTVPAGSQGWVTDGLMEVGSTVGEFIAPGVIPDTDTHRIAWAGTPNESASVEESRSGQDSYEWTDQYGYLRKHNSVKGASKRGLLAPPDSGLDRDLFYGIGGVGFDVRIDSLDEKEALYSAVASIDFGGMLPVDADSSELSKGVDYGRA